MASFSFVFTAFIKNTHHVILGLLDAPDLSSTRSAAWLQKPRNGISAESKVGRLHDASQPAESAASPTNARNKEASSYAPFITDLPNKIDPCLHVLFEPPRVEL